MASAALALLTVLATGCSKKIGDACTISTDCSPNGDRLCDTTQPAGYCTQFNCEPNSCPSDSLCVRFSETTCSAPTQSNRFLRTFCIATCENDGDCRAEYRCVDVNSEPGRIVVDLDPAATKVCVVSVASTDAAAASAAEPAICRAAVPSGDGGMSTSDGQVDGSLEAAPLDALASDSDVTPVDVTPVADVSVDGRVDAAFDRDGADSAGDAGDAASDQATDAVTLDATVLDVDATVLDVDATVLDVGLPVAD